MQSTSSNSFKMPRSSRRRHFVECSQLEARRLFCLVHQLGGMGSYPSDPTEETVSAQTHGPVGADSIDQLNVPAFSSRPGASKKLYLDFNGQNTIDGWSGWWIFGGEDAGPTPAYDIDNDQTSYSYQEKVNIEKVWKGVAEKFSPFDVDVTTVIPSSRSPGHSATVVIGGDGAWHGSGGGVGQVGGFNEGFFDGNSGNYAFVWDGRNNPKYMVEAVAHEAGHMFNLYHQSTAPIDQNEYAPGFIMGSGDATAFGRWGSTSVNGTFATTRDGNSVVLGRSSQDDLATLAADNFPFRADDFGSSIPTATTVSLTSVNGVLSASTSGVLTPSDRDVIKIVHTGGSFEAEVLNAEFRGMLDPQLTLTSSTGNTIQFSNIDNGSDGVGEKITVNSLAAGTYLLWIDSEGGYGNIGQWRLNVRAGTGSTTPNNTIGSAQEIGLQGDTGATGVGLGFGGNATIAESVQSTDVFDFFKVRLPQNVRTFWGQISGMTTSVELQFFKDANSNGVIDAGEVLATSAGGTATQALTLNTDLAQSDLIYIRTRNVGGGNSNYTLKLSSDVGLATLPSTVQSSFFDPSPYHGGFTIYDSIQPGNSDTVDYYRLHTEFAGNLATYVFETGGDVRVTFGNDTNNNGVLDTAEFIIPSTNTNDFPDSIPVPANANILIKVTGSVEANYNLFADIDYTTAGNTTGTLTGGLQLPAGNTGTFNEYVGYANDFFDTFKFNPTAGLFHAKLTMTDAVNSGAHRLQIIQDSNTNGIADAGEIVADGIGTELTFNITTFANYYLRVQPAPSGEFSTIGNYRLAWWSGNAVEPTGSSPSPITPTNTNQTFGGFLGFNPAEASLNDLEDRYTFTLPARTRFDVSLNNNLFGLQIYKQTGQTLQRMVGVGTYEGTISSLSANLDPGTYVVRAYLPVNEGAHSDTPVGGDYVMSYKTAAITDNSPPVVSSAGFQYETKSTGVYFVMDQDVAGSIDLSDASVLGLDNGFLFPLRQTHYDPATHTVGFDFLSPVLPDGHYRATLAAGSLKDLSNNPNASAFTFDFNVLSGDFTRDGVVNFDDLLKIAQNYGMIDTATFSMGDINYDHNINFDDLLNFAQKYGNSLFSASVIAGDSTKRDDVREIEDVLA